MKKKKSYVLVIICLLVFFTGCISKKTVKKETQQVTKSPETSETIPKSSIPTLFIHGYSGGSNSFGRMIKRMEVSGHTKKELVLTVNPEGEVQADGKVSGNQNNASIQVLFKDNKNNDWNQAEWIKNCLTYIQANYGVKEVNLVGHSMGGASSLRYLTTYGDDKNLPKVRKFISIAAPFNNFVELSNGETLDDILASGPSVKSERYTDYVKGIEKVSKSMNVLLIAGDLKDGSLSDEVVPVADALSPVSLFKSHGNDVQEKVFYGKSAQHSQLHENKEVDQLVADFLWNNN